ncbi:dUTP diphosphatase, partial [Lentibacillus populi]|uniref:dUTP diphosphatase n=1 Tax=Lentibacillus populi TaxID=1827502 RepID=UPI00166D6396
MKVKRLHKDAVLPRYAKQGDSGFDLVAVEDTVIKPGETKLIKTGLAFDIPVGFEIQVRPRSGISLNTKLRVTLGTVDSGYKGEVGVIVDNHHQVKYRIEKGMRIAQAVLAPIAHTTFEEVDELS